MQTSASCDLCHNPHPFMCNECSGRDMSDEGQEIVKAMHNHAPSIKAVHVARRSIVGTTVPPDFLYV